MPTSKTVVIFGSYAPSLLNFRGQLIETMIGRGHRVVAVAPDISAETAAALRDLGAEPRELPLVNTTLDPVGMIRSYLRVRSLFREVRPDVVIGYTIKPVVVGALAGQAERVPRIVSFITGVGYAFTEGRELKRLIARSSGWLLYRLALSRSHKVVFQNPDDRELFRRLRLLDAERDTYVVASSGVDLERFSPAPVPEQTAFLMISRLLKDKGIREFAEAAKRVKSKHPDVPISIVGYFHPSPDSLTREELDELIRCGVDFKGRLQDVRPAIADCSVFVLPSYREGGPQSILEAMSMGRAIITTDVPGCRHRVEDGVHGFVVPPRNPNALYEAMMYFVRDPSLAVAMGTRSRERAETEFGVDSVNSDLLEIAEL